MTMNRITKRSLALLTTLVAAALPAQAALLPSSLSVNASVSLDTANSLAPTGGATQEGELRKVVGGSPTTSSFTGNPTSISPSSLSGSLTATGDGVGALFNMSGSFSPTAGANATTDGLFADFLFNLSNGSATDTFVVTIRSAIKNLVSASGADAFANSDISVRDASNNELLFSDHRADTVNGDASFDSPNDSFSITLNPGASTSFGTLQRQRGGAFATGSVYSAEMTSFLYIDDVICRGNGCGGGQVPLPGTLPLLALALGALGVVRRRVAC
jgi:hypothetical protein